MNRSREHAQLLLQKARGDEHVLSRLIDDPQAPSWSLGFHAQQAVEKAIKAVLAAHSILYPYSHDLLVLLNLLRSRGVDLPPDAQELPRLTPFGALLRYEDDPEAGEAETPLDRSWMGGCVKRTLGWADETIGQGPAQ